MKSFFSIIIPTLNEEKYLSVILGSLAKQTFKDFEIIVVDASSKDKTVNVYQKYCHLMPRSAIYLTRRKNVAFQRNFGSKKATGKYLIFMDADINIEPTFLEEIHIASLKKKFPLATTWMTPDRQTSLNNALILMGNLAVEVAKGINQPFSGGYNTIIKREIFYKLGGFREDIKIGEDHDFAMRAEKKGIELTILKEPRVVSSLRRFRSEGRLAVFRKYAHAYLYSLVKGPVTTELFSYPMGGHVHKERRGRRIDLTKVNTYIKSIEKLEKKLNKLLLD